MSFANHGYDFVARGIVQSLDEMMGAHSGLAPARAVPAALADLCHQAERWNHVLRVEMPAGNFSGLEEFVDNPSVPVSIRRTAAGEVILQAKRLIGQGRIEQAERLTQQALKLSRDQEPLASAALYPYSTFLMRRAESPNADPFDKHATGVLASAMLQEHELNPYPSHQILTLARWLILAKRSGDAVRLIEEQMKPFAALTDGFANLCLFLWIAGDTSLAQKYLPRVDCVSATSDMGWFIRSVACAVAGDANCAAACLSSLYRQAPDFFKAQPGVTVWGMLALVLKALGHDALARSARSLAAQKDPWDSCRAHLWDQVSSPKSALPFPPFPLHADFTEYKS